MKFFLLVIFLSYSSSSVFAASPYFLFGANSGIKTDSISEYTGKQPYGFRAGDAMLFSTGAIFNITRTYPQRFELQFGLGYLHISDSSDNQKPISWDRYQLEAIYYFKNQREKIRFGWGPVYVFKGRINGHGINSTASSVVDKTLGWTIAADINISNVENPSEYIDTAIGFRYNQITYSAPNFSGEVNGDSIGVSFIFSSRENR